MRVRQYVYFALHSSTLPAAEMATRLGLEPDEVSVRGSRTTTPPRPVTHVWKVVCRDRGLTVDEQIDRVMARLRPYREQIAALARTITADASEYDGAVLEVVRHFDDADGEEERLDPP
ncbi:hypothetical protein GCM10023191_075170 [Actinoallomurus oryzae]|uniref:Uncharacterized protein n=1 Tax=Actinoallomurus oryzae TaxID=502180 RepID=A0ABP8QVQ7_9ACTN